MTDGRLIATDMGGTSFDIGLVTADGVKFYDFNPVIDRWLVSTPMTYLHTLGAGGGSIARYDRLWEAVEGGPESAGSDPGPACYGNGHDRPTVTDANLVLGRINAARPIGSGLGALDLDADDEIVRETLVSRAGSIVHARVAGLLEAAPVAAE